MHPQTRRGFLKLLGLGAAVAATSGIVLTEVEPVRRFWQVGRSAPVRDVGVDFDEAFDRYIQAMMRNARKAFDKRLEISMLYGGDVSLSTEHGHIYVSTLPINAPPSRSYLITNILGDKA